MYAIVEIAGKQYKIEKDKFIYAPLIQSEEGEKVNFEKVLFVDNNGKMQIGAPTVEGVKISAKILEHVKDDKVIVFKKKRRKGYKVKNGHRQLFSKVFIEDITLTDKSYGT
ncbi:MAG: 50S ribosomal protein L21 [Bacteroidota bacterium]